MSKKVKILLFGSLLTLAFVLLSTLVLPVIARNKVVSLLEAETGRKVHLEKITINPCCNKSAVQ